MDKLGQVVKANVRALLGLSDGDSGVGELIKRGIANGNAQRVLAGDVGISIERVAQLAAALDVAPWVLLVDGLDPNDLPTLHAPSTRWPFRKVDQSVIAGLAGTAAQQVENGLLVALASVGIAPRKPAPPPAEVSATPALSPRARVRQLLANREPAPLIDTGRKPAPIPAKKPNKGEG